jgi:hypothetical protein
MDYSVRSARKAAETGCEAAPPLYQGQHDPRAVYNALNALT